MTTPLDNITEWLEADGLGGFASGTASGERTRRYHALLLVASTPPTGRMVLVNGLDAWIETPEGRFAISTQRYTPDVVSPDGESRLIEFQTEPWPQWCYRIDAARIVRQELFVPYGMAACCLRWSLETTGSPADVRLIVRPFFSGRDYHALHHRNETFRFTPTYQGQYQTWHPYFGVQGICIQSNGQYVHAPEWYANFLYTQERSRGLDCVEDLASPGQLRFSLDRPARMILAADGNSTVHRLQQRDLMENFRGLESTERARRAGFATSLDRSADAYLVGRNLESTHPGRTIVAGYPWFTDWGRDTFISLRGLCLATGRVDDAMSILLAWADAVSEGMLPNRFTDVGGQSEYNSVDASLWFVVAVHDTLETASRLGRAIDPEDRARLQHAVLAIVSGYSTGTRYGIGMDRDWLLAAGAPGMQLTWMDAKVGDWVVTPRVGKPVEVQALWLNALWIASRVDRKWADVFAAGRTSFERRFWNPALDCLFDVVDVDHTPGSTDASLRPNQIFAVGGLPLALLHGERARNVVDAVESRLLTPLGLRTLAPGSPNYAAHYAGNSRARDAAYHQGTVWPWLMGPFVEAWLRVRGGDGQAKAEARSRFLPALTRHLQVAGIGHISEVCDAEPPFQPGGCPFQAWSLGEYLRLDRVVLAD